MTANDTFKATAFGYANSVHIVAWGEEGRADDVAGLHFFGEVAKFLDPLHRHAAEFFDVAEQRFGDSLFLLIVKTELNGIVAVTLLRFALEHAIRPGENNGHRRNNAL